MIRLFYTTFQQPLPEQRFEKYLGTLAGDQRSKIRAYHRWEDQHRGLFGKLLLAHALEEYNLESDLIHQIKKGTHDRPYINGSLDFNITHSGEWVICAVTDTCRVGIDVEQIKKVDLNDFGKTMTENQRNLITSSPKPEEAFFRMWVIKESVIKADGIGLTFHLDRMEYGTDSAKLEGKEWHYSVLDIGSQYACAVASDKPPGKPPLERVDFYI